MSRPAVFLDKDGTLVPNVPYNVDVGRMALLPGAAEGLRALHAAGFELVVVSNQTGVALGHFQETRLQDVGQRLAELFAGAGARLGGFWYCPHHPTGRVRAYARVCSCRKPRPGLLLSAARARGLDPAQSWMVGDILDDVEAGARAGCRTVLIDNGHETCWQPGPFRFPQHTAADLREAAQVITAPHAMKAAERAG
jgi:histidinol-phosphate phosphatase family protein